MTNDNHTNSFASLLAKIGDDDRPGKMTRKNEKI